MAAQAAPMRGMSQHLRRVGRRNPGRVKRLARQIEPADARILVEVAQDIGELQRAAEVMRERKAGIALHAEHPHRQASDRAGDAVAIEIERRAIGRADIGHDVHLHAVDDGEKILALKIECAHRLRQAEKLRRRRAGIERVDVGAPLLQRGAPQVARSPGSSAMSSTARQNE